MKTAISLRDDLLEAADEAARAMKVSRSGLFTLALVEFLNRRQQEKMIEQLNQAYSDQSLAGAARTVKRMKAKFRATIKDRW